MDVPKDDDSNSLKSSHASESDHAATLSQEQPQPKDPTKIAKKVSRVKQAVSKVIREREHFPKNLFWSLFHSQVEEIKDAKQQEARKRAIWLSGADEEL